MSSGEAHQTVAASLLLCGLGYLLHTPLNVIIGVSCVVSSHSQRRQLVFLWHFPAACGRGFCVQQIQDKVLGSWLTCVFYVTHY